MHLKSTYYVPGHIVAVQGYKGELDMPYFIDSKLPLIVRHIIILGTIKRKYVPQRKYIAN